MGSHDAAAIVQPRLCTCREHNNRQRSSAPDSRASNNTFQLALGMSAGGTYAL